MKYEVRLKPGFAAPRRSRAGITVVAGARELLELGEDQVAALQADSEFIVKAVESEATTPKSPTKKELIAAAEAEGLILEGVTAKSTVAEIEAAVAGAREKGGNN